MTFIRDHITHSPVLVHHNITLGHAEQEVEDANGAAVSGAHRHRT